MTKLSLLFLSYLEPILHVECEVRLQEKEERCWDYAVGDLKGGDGGLRDGFKRRKKEQQRMVSCYGASLLLHPCHVSPWGRDGRQQ